MTEEEGEGEGVSFFLKKLFTLSPKSSTWSIVREKEWWCWAERRNAKDLRRENYYLISKYLKKNYIIYYLFYILLHYFEKMKTKFI